MTKKTSIDDIIGIVKTDEVTDSVSLKKEAQLSICEKRVIELAEENEQLKQQIQQVKEDARLLLAMYRWYPFAVEKKEHQAYNRLWDFVND